MPGTENRLYTADGTLAVQARGYWFTAGGEKGAFGYYPHLKDRAGYPVFPDTQVHGDLRMAANWLKHLAPDVDDALIDRVFGREGGVDSALLRVGDLELTDDEKAKVDAARLFEIKPRIKIHDGTRTVADKMLVDREVSFLDGRTLSCDIYLGNAADPAELDRAQRLVSDCAGFLSGFGGFRSRGYGRGKAAVQWKADAPPKALDNAPSAAPFQYFLTALVNFRNKPIEPGAAQVLDAIRAVKAEQLRGWFVRAYRELFGAWPSPEQMAAIQFPTMYPSDAGRGLMGHPPPMTALKNENDDIVDTWGWTPDRTKNTDDETFFRTKAKPLSADFSVADGPGGPAALTPVESEHRFRNRMDADGRFTTVEKGLFVQELIKKGGCFAGVVRFKAPDPEFLKKALRVFRRRPRINGALFEPDIRPLPEPARAEETGPWLTTAPIPLTDRRTIAPETTDDRITLTSPRRFNTMLARPRRNRIVFAPGSILTAPAADSVGWSGFGESRIDVIRYAVEDRKQHDAPRPKTPQPDIKKVDLGNITRSQAGLLREYLHPALDAARIRENLDHRIEKYGAKSNDVLKNLLKAVRLRLDEDGPAGMRRFIQRILEELAIEFYKGKQKSQGNRESEKTQ